MKLTTNVLIALSALVVCAPSQAQVFRFTREQMIKFTADNPFERFEDGRPKAPDALLAKCKDLSAEEAAATISSALGKPVKCVETTIDQARAAMRAMGMPDFVVEIIMEQYIAFREGRLDSAEPRTPDTTTPTTLAEFSRNVLVPAIKRSFVA